MTYQGRSPDDQPLAAYSTGAVPDQLEDELPPEAPHLTQQEAIALAMGIDQPQPAPEPEAEPKRRSGPRFSLPRLRLPKLGLPSRPAADASVESAPAMDVMAPEMAPPPMAPRPAMAPPPMGPPTMAPPAMAPRPPIAPPSVAPAPRIARGRTAASSVAAPALPPLMASAGASASASMASALPPLMASGGAAALPVRSARRGFALPKLGALPRTPRAAVRDPRVLAAVAVVVGIVVVLVGLTGRGGPLGGGATDASPSPVAPVVAPPGAATLTLTGDVTGEYSLTGSTGTGRPADDHLDSSWSDTTGTSLALTGRAGSGTRTTAEGLVLTLTVLVNGSPVTFTSEDGECTVGMAVQPTTVRGSYVCKDLTSADGKLVVKATGTYQT
jgi:hypothetical protein